MAPATPLSLANADQRYLAEWPISGKTAHQKHRTAMQAAIAQHAGIVVDYDEIAGSWRLRDYSLHAFEAAVVMIRAAADRSDRSVAAIGAAIAGAA